MRLTRSNDPVYGFTDKCSYSFWVCLYFKSMELELKQLPALAVYDLQQQYRGVNCSFVQHECGFIYSFVKSILSKLYLNYELKHCQGVQ